MTPGGFLMFIINYISEHYIMLMELVGLFVLLSISTHLSQRIKSLTRAVGILLILTSVLYEIEKWTQSFETLSIARPLLTACIYSMYPIILILTMLITTEKKLTSLQMCLLLLPEIISAPIFFSSQWSHVVFWYSESNHYLGSAVAKWPYMLFGLYALIFIVLNLIFLKYSTNFYKLIVVLITAIPLIGVILYLITDFSDDYTGLFTSSLVIYYLFMYIFYSRVDALTGLLNRKSFYIDADSFGSRVSALVSVDMNNLKFINDNFGHHEGDEALKTISKILNECSGRNATAYRIGGDEFVILYKNANEKFIEERIEDMRTKISEACYVCAFGYVMKKNGDNVESMLRDADKKMYADKAALKKTVKQTL